MDPRIKELKTTTFSGRRLSRRQISEIQETVALLPGNSRGELCKTICEHLGWKSAKGSYKVGACMGMLEHLEKHGVLKLPPKRKSMVRTGGGKPVWSSASDPQPEISAPLSELGPVRLEIVADAEGRQLWNALVDRHHYLGYKRPFGEHIRYFLLDSAGRRLGCMLFESSTRSLPRRDRWIGWSDRVRNRRRHLVAVNSRFLVLPWVSVKNLASHALGLARRRLADDWEAAHGFRPALCETFVDEGRFRASCYRAANWLRIGETSGGKGKSRKGVYVLPLSENCREILRGDRPEEKAARSRRCSSRTAPSSSNWSRGS